MSCEVRTIKIFQKLALSRGATSTLNVAVPVAQPGPERGCRRAIRRDAARPYRAPPDTSVAGLGRMFQRLGRPATVRGRKKPCPGLRAAASLARRWRDQHRAAKARELLGSVYRCFIEGFNRRTCERRGACWRNSIRVDRSIWRALRLAQHCDKRIGRQNGMGESRPI